MFNAKACIQPLAVNLQQFKQNLRSKLNQRLNVFGRSFAIMLYTPLVEDAFGSHDEVLSNIKIN